MKTNYLKEVIQIRRLLASHENPITRSIKTETIFKVEELKLQLFH